MTATGTMAGGWGTPGIGEVRETFENEFLWGMTGHGQKMVGYQPGVLLGAARDAGNTPTVALRAGLLLSRVGENQWLQYDPTVAAQSVAGGILPVPLQATDPYGSDADRAIPVVVFGNVIASRLIGLDGMARRQLFRQFLFDDDLLGVRMGMPVPNEVPKATSYQILPADNGTMFTNAGAAGAVTFTLPAIGKGYVFEFLGIANQNIVIASSEGTNIVTTHNAGASSITFSTASQIIGSHLKVFSNKAGTLWYTVSGNTTTKTIA